MSAQRTCERAGCDRPHEARGLCAMHYERERETWRHRARPERVIPKRARNRATTLLIAAHREEFDRLVAQVQAEIAEEHEQLLAAAAEAPTDGVVRLRGGPRPADEDVEDRAAPAGPLASCPRCSVFHEAGHCPPAVAALARGPATADGRIAALLRQGRPARWVAAQLGEPLPAVLRVLDRQRREEGVG